MIMKAKRSWSQAAPEEIALLKKSCSWRIVLLKTRGPEATSSEAAPSEAAEVASSEAASSEAASSEVISPEAEDQLDLQNIQRLKNLHCKSCLLDSKTQQKISGTLQRSFQRCLKACACNLDESVDIVLLYELYSHVLHYSVLCPRFKTRKQLQNTVSPAYMFLWIRNGFQIGSS